MVGRLFALLVLLCGVAGLSRVAAAQAGATIYYTPNQAQPASPQAVTPTFPLPVTPGSGGFPTTPAATTPAITFQGRITLTAATNTTLTNANVTMDLGSLPTAGAFKNLTLIPPTSCTVNVRFDGTAATATTGEQMGSGTNVGTDTWNLTGQTNAPTLYSTAGCTNIVFRG